MEFDPPLRRRLLWRDPLSPETLISEDRGLMARTFGTLAGVSALLGMLILLIHADPGRDYDVLKVIVVVLLVLGAACLIGYRRLPIWFFHLALGMGSVMIVASAAAESTQAAGVVSLYLVWIVLLGNLFFGVRAAFVHAFLAAAAYALVLYLREVAFWQNYAVATVAVLGAAGLVVGWLRRRLERVAAQLDLEAKTDPVTGVANRRGFNQRCDLELARARRDGTPLSLIVCDLDYFKRVNDQLGHDEGDVALRVAAEAISSSIRAVDEVGRLGGEEFGIVLPGADHQEAMVVALRVGAGIRKSFADRPVRLTISCGVAPLGEAGLTRDDLLRSADRALYEAKRLGRDRIVAAPGSDRRPAAAKPAQTLSASSAK